MTENCNRFPSAHLPYYLEFLFLKDKKIFTVQLKGSPNISLLPSFHRYMPILKWYICFLVFK